MAMVIWGIVVQKMFREEKIRKKVRISRGFYRAPCDPINNRTCTHASKHGLPWSLTYRYKEDMLKSLPKKLNNFFFFKVEQYFPGNTQLMVFQ